MREPQRATINYVIGVNECSQQCRVFNGEGYMSDAVFSMASGITI